MDDVAGGEGVTGVDFSDERMAIAWLGDQSAELRCILCSRAALRGFGSFAPLNERVFERVAITSFRAALASSAKGARKFVDAKVIKTAATAARFAAGLNSRSTDSNTVDDLAYKTARSAASAAAASTSVDSAFRSIRYSVDIRQVNADIADHQLTDSSSPLWHYESSKDDGPRNHHIFLSRLDADRSTWGFWHDWYLAMWEGRFTDWDLAIEVAKIPNDVWEQGAEAVALEIAKLKDKHLSEKLPQIEIIFETETGEYDVRASVADPSTLVESVLARVSFAFQTALESNACDLNAMSLPAKILRQVFENCRDDPNAIEQFFRQASEMIKRKIAEGQFADDDELELLTATLDESALQMRADHPDVGSAAEKRLKQKLREIDDAHRLEIAKRIGVMTDGTTGRLAVEFALASETVGSDSGTEAQAIAIKMSGERAAKISMSERAKNLESSGPMSGLKIGMRAQSLVDMVVSLFTG